MAISEYAVPDDFFHVEDNAIDKFGFPCCVCRHKIKSGNQIPCKFCGHNENAEDHFNCCLCDEIQPGNREKGNYIAIRTPAGIGPMCLTCYNTIINFKKE